MPFILRERKGRKRVYAGDVKGWIGGEEPKPPKPEEEAKQFDSADAAKDFARAHGMDAEPEEAGAPAVPPDKPKQ